MRDNNNRLTGKRYVMLARCSSLEQADTSTADQLNLLRDIAANRGLIAAGGDVVLDGVSGSKPGARDDIDELIARKRERDDFDVLLVQDASRLTRGGAEHGNYIKWLLRKEGITVVFADGVVSDNPDNDAMMQGFAFWAAQYQAKQMSFNVSRGQMSSLAAGNIAHTFRTPYGVDRLYVGIADGKPRHRIRNLTDGTQQMLAADSETVLNRYARNPRKGASVHYRRQPDEKIVLMPGSPEQVAVVRQMYRRKLVEGKGSFSIAKELNDRGVRSADGGMWVDGSVDRILRNSVYTGVGIAGQEATGLYNVRGTNGASPNKVSAEDYEENLKRRSVRNRPRPETDWVRQDHPLLVNYLGDDLRELAVEWHAKVRAKRAAKGAEPHKKQQPGGDRHGHSPYVLKDLLRSKQEDRPMKGKMAGPDRYRKRYYATARGGTAPKTGSVLSKMVPAEPLERAVLAVVKDVLLDEATLRDSVVRMLERQRLELDADRTAIGAMVAERGELTAKVKDAWLLGPSTRKLMQADFDRWEAQLQSLEQRIALAEKASPPAVDVDATVAVVTKRLAQMAESLDAMPPAAVRQLLSTVVSKLVVDLETREVEMELSLAEGWEINAESNDGKLCVVRTNSWSRGDDAQRLRGLKIAIVQCEGTRGWRNDPACFTCSRHKAA